jgi:ABC-type dipeptide/oligopeptide/nickel transport system ATPase component
MSLQPIIQINKLRIQANNKTLLYIESLCCNAGEIHAIIGESGSGKSLTLLTIIGLLPKNLTVSGEVLLWNDNRFIETTFCIDWAAGHDFYSTKLARDLYTIQRRQADTSLLLHCFPKKIGEW